MNVILLGLMLASFRTVWAAQEPDVTLEFIQTEHPSSFPTLMRISISNVTYTPLNLVDKVKASQLLIDGKSSWRKELPFEGPPGLPAMGHWEACVPVSDYADSISPGWHHMVLGMGEARSKEVEVKWAAPIDWRKGNLKTRMAEVHDMAASLKKGLPRSCVEEWLSVKDGEEQESSEVRYFLEPFIKVLVLYTHQGGTGLDDEVIDGPAQVYQENRIKD